MQELDLIKIEQNTFKVDCILEDKDPRFIRLQVKWECINNSVQIISLSASLVQFSPPEVIASLIKSLILSFPTRLKRRLTPASVTSSTL